MHDPSAAEQSDGEADQTALSVTEASPWFSRIFLVVSVAIWLGLNAEDDLESWEVVAQYGFLPADAVFNGAWWGLVTSAFVHIEIWHLAFNMFWLWSLGSRLERAIGSWPFLGFCLMSAFVSSSLQLAVSDATGIGASGVVYAIFGFMSIARNRYPQFQEILDDRTRWVFVGWLVVCVVLTRLNVVLIGNTAHVSGLLTGAVVASLVIRWRPWLTGLVLAGLVTGSIVPLVWCPWSVTWLSQQAYSAHLAERYAEAIDYYSQIIRRDPRNAWALMNRGLILRSIGDREEGEADMQRAREIDPSVDASVSNGD